MIQQFPSPSSILEQLTQRETVGNSIHPRGIHSVYRNR